MKTKLLIIFITLCWPLMVLAQKGFVEGAVSDPILEIGLNDADVTLMKPDSTIVGKTKSEYNIISEKIQRDGYSVIAQKSDTKSPAPFKLEVDKEGQYILKVVKKGYETLFQNINVKFNGGSKQYDIGEVWMTRQAVQLKGVTVHGTLLKMVYKGDTIVYNAAAFQTAEGDMLGNLIEKLPGAQIKDGRISVNGRFVESLLINGKDFFNGNIEQALRSLPAFTVSKIKTFDKAGEMSETTGQDMHDKIYTMDVQLKRKYQKTWITSNYALGGTNGRYDLQSIIMRMDERLAFCFVGEANNINKRVDAYDGSSRGWITLGDGIRYSKAAFGSFRYEPSNKLKVGATASIRNIHEYTGVNESRETFLQGGNTFGRSENSGKNVATQIRTDADLRLRPQKGLFFSTMYKLQYENSRNNSMFHSASFLTRPDSLFRGYVLDNVFSQTVNTNLLREWVQSRLQQEQMKRNNFISNKLSINGQKSFGSNLLALNGEVYQSHATYKTYDLYHVDYPHATLPEDYRHRFFDNGYNEFNYSAGISYIYKYALSPTTNAQIKPYYTFRQNYDYSGNPLYRLDWSEQDTPQIDVLPSTTEALMTTLDKTNTYYAWHHDTRHEAGLEWSHEFQLHNRSWMMLSATLPFSFQFNRMDYERNEQYHYVSRVSRYVNPTVSLRWRPVPDDRNGSKTTLTLRYNSTGLFPNMYNLLNVKDTTDPLNLWMGNPGLKNARNNQLQFNFSHNWPQSSSSLYSNYVYTTTSHAVAVKRTYEATTGVITSQPVNIDGNWTMNWINEYIHPLDKKQIWTLTAGANWNFLHSKDLNFWDGAASAKESVVRTSMTSANIKLRFRPNTKWDINVSLRPTWNHVTGSRQNFTTINALDMNYNIDTYTELPFGIDFYNTFDIISRFGYADESMNDTRVLWNSSLAKELKYGLIIELKACDLLHQNRRATATINAQGRVERYYRMLPAYFMAGIHWNFSKLVGNKK